VDETKALYQSNFQSSRQGLPSWRRSKTHRKGEVMKKIILLLATVLVAGTAFAGETVKGEFTTGGFIDSQPGAMSIPEIQNFVITLQEGKYKDCLAYTSGKMKGVRVMLDVDKITCNGTETIKAGSVYDEVGVKGIDTTLAFAGKRSIMPGTAVIVKLK
jgi:hypothetical protein